MSPCEISEIWQESLTNKINSGIIESSQAIIQLNNLVSVCPPGWLHSFFRVSERQERLNTEP
uniref:Uncharacterized protein n=1 Tax=Siphoviridae sp. ctTDf8 TaxID=2825517 RepID=A0A8S5UJ10_9CAUD|nr:MAG TPA: hypothetical protein [Siphoviridae sp. ctTDf8]